MPSIWAHTKIEDVSTEELGAISKDLMKNFGVKSTAFNIATLMLTTANDNRNKAMNEKFIVQNDLETLAVELERRRNNSK